MLRRKARSSLAAWLMLSPILLCSLFPFLVLVSSALKSADEIHDIPPRWIPLEPTLRNFGEMWAETGFATALGNSAIVCGATVALTVLLALPLAYVMSRSRLRAVRHAQSFLLLTQMVPPMVLVLGLFQVAIALNLVNTLTSLVLAYTGFFLAFAAWMLRSYIDSIPYELEEAAMMEGASRLRILAEVISPLALPAIAVTAIFTFINAWNEFVLALTMLRSEDKYTLTIQIFSQVGGRYVVAWHHVMAATAAAVVPVAIVFAMIQGYMVRGLTMGAVK